MSTGLKLLFGVGLATGVIYFLRSSKMKRCRNRLQETAQDELKGTKKALRKAIEEVENQAEELWSASRSILKSVRRSL